MSTTTDLSVLKINYLTQTQYDDAKSQGTLEANEIYMTPVTNPGVEDVEVDGVSVVTDGVAEITMPTVPTKVSQLQNDSGYITGYTETDPTVPSWAKASSKPTYTYSEVGAAASSHSHGNITNGGDITAAAPTIASGDQIVINDNSASKITNGPTFDGSTTTKALTPKGTWETFLQSYTETDPTVPSWAKASSKPSYTASEVSYSLSNVQAALDEVKTIGPSASAVLYDANSPTAFFAAVNGWDSSTVNYPSRIAGRYGALISTPYWTENAYTFSDSLQILVDDVGNIDCRKRSGTTWGSWKPVGGVLVLTVASFSSLPQTVSDSRITDDMVCLKAELGTPSAQTGDWTVTTSAGSLTISGSISGSTTATLYLARKEN